MIDVIPIPAFKDNYIWVLINKTTNQCIGVDPGDATPLLDFLAQHQLTLSAIFITHHHPDHIGGIATILKDHQVPVYGPRKENISFCTHPLIENNMISIQSWPVEFLIKEVPGHTLGHIFFYSKPWLFCGDTLFSIGCGRLFEGSPEQMYSSLKKITELPDETQIYCTHEYTLNNIKFAQKVDPNNENLNQYQHHCQILRAKNLPTLPSNLALEKACNPFLRCTNALIKKTVEDYCHQKFDTSVQIFAALRAWKDKF